MTKHYTGPTEEDLNRMAGDAHNASMCGESVGDDATWLIDEVRRLREEIAGLSIRLLAIPRPLTTGLSLDDWATKKIAEEREACARAVEDAASNTYPRNWIVDVAQLIRARGKEKP